MKLTRWSNPERLNVEWKRWGQTPKCGALYLYWVTEDQTERNMLMLVSGNTATIKFIWGRVYNNLLRRKKRLWWFIFHFYITCSQVWNQKMFKLRFKTNKIVTKFERFVKNVFGSLMLTLTLLLNVIYVESLAFYNSNSILK